ncbi:RNA polymerase sigma-70 factor [Parapedobacter sp. 10938]|uniref:RNA polymerase sigma-70 factor n=1 Tax=Parapedobacter flavus TaxID=3110225 RepID=UPI002DBD48CE|nr:RNA polymerase sigma-70 factor [Parapedobacter sp. 10938]MEC3879283.1 RNA polymerase sigma-70 factor [Parapedobacter sp. 10938]
MDYKALSDKELVGALSHDDQQALGELYDRYWKRLLLISLSKLSVAADVEEIVNDTFYDLWRSRKKLDIKTNVARYLFAIVRYKIFAHLAAAKKRKHIVRLDDLEGIDYSTTAESTLDALLVEECQGQIEQAVNNLPDKCKLVFKLSRNQGLSINQISQRLELSPKTVEGHLSNALKKLRVSLSQLISILIFPFLF